MPIIQPHLTHHMLFLTLSPQINNSLIVYELSSIVYSLDRTGYEDIVLELEHTVGCDHLLFESSLDSLGRNKVEEEG